VGLLEVLPLEQDAGEFPLHGLDERIDEAVIVRTGDSFVSPADVEWAAESCLIVRADVEQDR
jgi:hypothetical protein